MTQPVPKPPIDDRRRGVRRTALVVGLVAVGVYVGFLLMVMLP